MFDIPATNLALVALARYFARCDNALPAVDFAALLALGSRRTLEAFDAAARLLISTLLRYCVNALAAADFCAADARALDRIRPATDATFLLVSRDDMCSPVRCSVR